MIGYFLNVDNVFSFDLSIRLFCFNDSEEKQIKTYFKGQNYTLPAGTRLSCLINFLLQTLPASFVFSNTMELNSKPPDKETKITRPLKTTRSMIRLITNPKLNCPP